MRITWVGGPTTLLEFGAFRVVTDPVFADRLAMPEEASSRTVPVPDVALDNIQAICLTSIRPDHFSVEAVERIGEGTPVLVPAGAVATVQAAGFSDVRELAWYGDTILESSGEKLTITAVPAQSPSGDGNGWFFGHDALGDSFTAYCTGDALWSDEIRKVQRELGYSNLLIQHLGAERSSDGSPASPDGKEAMQFVYRMQPNAIVPVHHHTYSHYREPVEAFIDHVGRTIYDRRLRVLTEGESWEK